MSGLPQFQVVAVGQSTGRRFAVKGPHESFARAEWHLSACRAAWPAEVYAIDVTYIGSDGQVHWRADVDHPSTCACNSCLVAV